MRNRFTSQLWWWCQDALLAGISDTKHFPVLNELDNMRSRVCVVRRKGANWTRTQLRTPDFGTVTVSGVDPDESDDY
jgi:hypothetical protein